MSCPDCNHTFFSRKERRRHMNYEHTKAKCSICMKKFYDDHRLTQHMGNTMQHNKPFFVTACGKGFLSGAGMKAHKKTMHEVITDSQHGDENRKSNINKNARQFHDKYARHIETSDEAFLAANKVADIISGAMRGDKLINRVEYSGSTWEGTSIPGVSDFDIKIIVRDPQISVDTSVSLADAAVVSQGYEKLTINDTPYIPSDEMAKMIGKTRKIINKTELGKYDVELSNHGPAIQVDVIDKKEKIASIDLVFTVEVVNQETIQCFVPKAPKTIPGQPDRSMFWRKCHSLKAKDKLKGADVDNGCRREVLRTCKVIRNKEPNLKHMKSHFLKTALFHVMDSSNVDWDREQIGVRVLDVLRYLQNAYSRRQLYDYFEKKMNLLAGINDATAMNTSYRLNSLINSLFTSDN